MLPAQAPTSIPKPLLLAIAFLQGLALLALYRALDAHHWPWHQPVYLYPLATVALITPILCLLSFTHGRIAHYAQWIGVFTVSLLVAAAYTGWQLEPYDQVGAGSITFIFVVATLVASFKALMYIQQRGSGQPISYASLFIFSWRNFLVLGLSLVFIGIFWSILFLCAQLFKVIKIDAVENFIQHDWFVIPVLTLAFGFAIIIFRGLASIIDTIAKVVQMAIKVLLPLLIAVAVAFLAALPFTGLQTLWGTGHGTLLILWLQVLVLFFLNAVYQDASHIRPYPNTIHRGIYCGVALLPIYSVIASFGLYARIQHYGLSVERCWALMLWLLLALFSCGYWWAIVSRRDHWIEKVSHVNIRMGWAVLIVAILANTPLLDFKKIALADQMRRLDKGLTTIDTLDVRYIVDNLGRSGYLQLEKLKLEYASTKPNFAQRIEAARNGYGVRGDTAEITREQFAAGIKKVPEDFDIPEALLSAIYKSSNKNDWERVINHNYYLVKRDLNNDGQDDYVLLGAGTSSGRAELWYDKNGAWTEAAMQSNKYLKITEIDSAINSKTIEVIPHQWQQLKLGELVFTVGAGH